MDFFDWLEEAETHLLAVIDSEEYLAEAGTQGMVAESAVEHVKTAAKIIAALKGELSPLEA
ncbi:MAG: hypothetical protein MR998_07720 [Lachnospiraceae bacterium]|nr:hypothetical protein [Lachnospiraceae bacterium]